MGRPKGKHRFDGSVDMRGAVETGEFMDQFPPEERQEQRFEYDLGSSLRVIQRWVEYRGKPVWFAFMLQALVGDRWLEMVRVDTCHDEAHVHYLRRDGAERSRKVLCSLGSVEDVERGWDHACDIVLESADENLRRWR